MGPIITCFQLFPCWGSTTPTVLKQYFSSQARFLPQSLFHSQSPTHPKNIKKSKNGFNSFQAKYQTDTIQIASSYRHAFRTKAATMLQCCKCHACCVCVINCVCDREGWPITCGSKNKSLAAVFQKTHAAVNTYPNKSPAAVRITFGGGVGLGKKKGRIYLIYQPHPLLNFIIGTQTLLDFLRHTIPLQPWGVGWI